LFVGLSLLGAGGLAALRGVACERKKKKKNKILFLFLFPNQGCLRQQAASRGPLWGCLVRNYLFIYIFFSQATPRSAAGPPAPSRGRPTKENKK
jgi:hypothetical protein